MPSETYEFLKNISLNKNMIYLVKMSNNID